ncbi:MAG: DNA-processing protein DprA [Caldisericia bacterium]
MDWLTLAVLASRKPSICSAVKESCPDKILDSIDKKTFNDARKLAEAELRGSESEVITQNDEKYPVVLFHLESPPVCLFMRGNADLNEVSKKSVAMVGTRKATPQGMHIARSFARDIASSGVSIVSGLADGIDSSSHEGCLDVDGATVAVIGSGIGKVTGRKKSFAERIMKKGAIVSEFPDNFPAGKWTFTWRNRIIAALSSAIVVVEAPEKSGALITARKAMELGRDVMACPGLPGMSSFGGCNRLIKDSAILVDNPNDVLEVLGVNLQNNEAVLSDLESRVVAACSNPLTLDELCSTLNLPPEGVLPVLTILDLKNIIKKLPGGTYMRSSLK